jgi:hypothetical protein
MSAPRTGLAALAGLVLAGLLVACCGSGAGATPASGDSLFGDDDPSVGCGETGCPDPGAPVCYGQDDGSTPTCVAALTFAPCASRSDCPGPDAICYGLADGYATGMCARPETFWTSNTDLSDVDGCGPGSAGSDESAGTALETVANGQHVSLGGNVCVPRCGAGGACADGYACLSTRLSGDTDVCVVHCTSDASCPGTTCDPYTHHCEAVDPTLQDDGDSCDQGSDCRSGSCWTNSEGYLDGECFSECVEPAPSAYTTGPLPGSDCPGTEVCAATKSPVGGPHLVSECRPRCTQDADCRSDYVCHHEPSGDGAGTSADGFCGIRDEPYLSVVKS